MIVLSLIRLLVTAAVAAVLVTCYRRGRGRKFTGARSGSTTNTEKEKGKRKNADREPSHIDFSQLAPFAEDFDYTRQQEVPYRPWHDGPYHVTMGIKNVQIEDWIELDKTYLERYALKKELFANQREQTTQILPGCEDAAFEALYLLADLLPRRFPTMFRSEKENVIENLVTGETWDLARDASTWEQYHPLEVMGLLSTEDFFLLTTDEKGVSSLRAGAVCFPAGWKIQERIGSTLWQLHAGKVPSYETKLAKSMDRFFVRLRVGGAIQRFNYAIDDSAELFHPHSHHNLSLDKKVRLEDLHLRVERQVLQRLPRTRALLFSIRTYVTPITEVTRDKEVARALRTSVGSYGEDVAKYKNKPLWDAVMKKHLDEILAEEDVELSQ